MNKNYKPFVNVEQKRAPVLLDVLTGYIFHLYQIFVITNKKSIYKQNPLLL